MEATSNKVGLETRQVRWLLWGGVLAFVASAAFHFGYDKTGFAPLMLVCAINESIWEHMKILFFGGLLVNAILYFTLFRGNRTFLVGAAVGLSTIVVGVPLIVLGYSSVLGKELFLVDFVLSIVMELVCQTLIYRFLKSRRDFTRFWKASVVVVALLVVVFVLLGFFPPSFGIFVSPE